ncbi:cell wall Awa1p-like [Schistosoma japonicum]|uniref:Cell wall Awa1p-like n=1 Tax=Schistosoma japonicum TaxID=6182 RepID=A0A4Z2CPW6_SCHJA|nr:cell wall Awa1p-like [Schistosoma japonicum]TNN06144.1 cell wall Awa1p-like [Schistosoma japonicum]
MSQAPNTTTSVSNNNSNTPWNRTPGKPGISTVVASSYPTFSAPSIAPWSANRNDAIDLLHERVPTEDTIEKSQPIRSLVSYANNPKNSDTSTTITTGQMWPLPAIFDSSRPSDRNAVGGGFLPQESSTTDNQWGTTPFSGQTTQNVSSLLGSPNTFPNSGHTQAPNPWSFDNVTNNCPSVPRAITGQQQNVVTLTNTPPDSSSNSDRTRRYMHWPLGSEQDLLNDDRSGLAFPLSSININSNNNSVSGFTNQSDFLEIQSISSNARVNNKLSEFDIGQSGLKKSSSDIDSCACDAEEAIRTAVNTTEPWGIHPVDQSTPWNCSEANGDCLPIHSSGPITGSPSVCEVSTASRISSHNQPSGVSTVQPTSSQSSLHSRRLSSTTSVSRDLESNVWPSEPPNGTGIWESHYESLGERTARWHQSSSSSPQTSQAPFSSQLINPTNFTPNQISHSSIRSRSQQPSQLPPTTDNFRAINRAVPGTIFPIGQPPSNSGVMNLGTRPIFGGSHTLGPINSNVGTSGSCRNFPIANPVNLGSGVSWPYSTGTHSGDPSVPGINFGNKSRWPGPNMNRLPGKQQHPTPHVLPNMTSTGVRWPPGAPATHVQSMWPLTDQRRPGTVQWSSNTPGIDSSCGGFFNQPSQSMTPRVSQQIGTSEFPSSLTPARGANQQFRTPLSALYPTITPGFSSSSSVSQRMFMSPQQHSHQLQQQSMIRAHIMRQLFNLGFTEDEIQPIFADTNTNVERALIDLRDRSGHQGINDLITSLKPVISNLLPTLSPDDARLHDTSGQSTHSNRPITATMRGNEVMRSNVPVNNSQPTENLELSLQLLQQRETQILQTIVQLHSKHQDLNQKLSHIRSANVPFATNPVMHELQLQAFQVVQQIDAQQAQLKHVRSQASMLKQITVSSTNLSGSQVHNTTITPSLINSSVAGQPVTNLHMIPGPSAASVNPMNCSAFNLSTSSASALSSWSPISTQSGRSGKTNQPSNISAVSNNLGSENADFLQDQSNFNMNSLLWESSPWSGSSPHLNDNFSTNRSSLSTDRRWTSSGSSNGNGAGGTGGVIGTGNNTGGDSLSSSRLQFLSSQLSSLGDPRWSDLINNDMTNSTNSSDAKRQSMSAEMMDELQHNSSGCAGTTDYPMIPMSISNKSWLLAHNIPPHISVGMLKMTVSSALNNHCFRSMEYDKSSDRTNNDIDFEIHPNMSARWVLLGLNNSTHMSIVHDCLEGGSSISGLGHGNGRQTGCYGSIKVITPAEALLHLQDIQSLASRLKGLNTDGCQSTSSANIHSLSQLSSSNVMRCDFNENSINSINDSSGPNHLMIGLNGISTSTVGHSSTSPPPPANIAVTTINNHNSSDI